MEKEFSKPKEFREVMNLGSNKPPRFIAEFSKEYQDIINIKSTVHNLLKNVTINASLDDQVSYQGKKTSKQFITTPPIAFSKCWKSSKISPSAYKIWGRVQSIRLKAVLPHIVIE